MEIGKLSMISRVLSLIGAGALVISLFVPLWRIELEAPQYPEGLALQIFPNKIAGDVNIINGLNHYIGMKTLHTEDFIEFTLLPYLIGFFALLFLLTALLSRKKLLYSTLTLFLLFGIVSMIDFYRWNYNYGHDLDPNAAIKVPGMAYQPPLIGYKQLLNFGAYSIPDTGGWLFIIAGILILTAVVIESGILLRFSKSKAAVILVIGAFMTLSVACSSSEPEAVQLHKDKCDFCKMSIADGRFAAQLKTEKGRSYKFDDVYCMVNYLDQNPEPPIHKMWVADYQNPQDFVDVTGAVFVESESLRSPMGGNTAAFSSTQAAKAIASQYEAAIVGWPEVNQP